MLFGLLISSPRNVWVCGSKVLGHFNTVIIIIIEIKQHSSLGRRAPWTFFFFFCWRDPNSFWFLVYKFCVLLFCQLVGCFALLFFSRKWGFWFFIFILRHFVCYFWAQKVCCPAFTFISGFWPIYRSTNAAVTTCVGDSLRPWHSWPTFWRQFSVGCRRLRLPVIIYGLHICLDFVLLLQLAAGIMKLANCGTADMGKGR